ncbi:MAG: hypothetical protein Q9208_006255 [Pyrenodesmia sp. 3 TL-2023]
MDPGTAVAVVTLSAKILEIIRKYYKNVEGAQGEIESLANELKDLDHVMQEFQKLVGSSSKLPVAASLGATIKQALSELESLENELVPGNRTKAMRHFGKRALRWPFAKSEVEQWIIRLQRLKETANFALNTDQTSRLMGVDANVIELKQGQEASEQERLLAKLPFAVDASFDSYHRQHEPRCIENTRVELLQQHREWGVGHARPLYWLSGMAGTGKSTIARTLADYFHSIGTLGGSFFFSRSSGEANNAVNFVGTLARHLANISPQLKQSVCEAISSHEDVTRQGLRNQWKELILAPLSKTQSKGRTTLNFVIDALDECGSDDDIKRILQLCVEVKGLKEVSLGVFVTSRPEIAIRLGFEAIPEIIYQELDLRDVPRHIVEHDLLVFLKHEFGRISRRHKMSGWTKDEDLRSLVQQSDCLFIYATTACRYISDLDWDPEERLSEVLIGGPARGGNTAGLDTMYMQVLTSSLIIDRSEAEVTKVCDRFKQIVGSIVTLFDELSITGLAGLLGMPNKAIEQSLRRLHSVLDIPKDVELSIRLLHPSFRDFLLDGSRCSDKRFSLDRGSKHEQLAKHCLGVMSKCLKRNMGHLKTPGSPPGDAERTRLNTELPKHVRYACQYWVDHLEGIRADPGAKHNLPDDGHIQSFFQRHFLHWLEAMSLMAKMSQAVLMITRLGDLLKRGSDDSLRAIVEDARRFILSNRGIIEKAPLQTYASALVFSPKESLIRQFYLDQLPSWLIRSPTVEDRWGNCVQNLEMSTIAANESLMAFSSDGKYIASSLYSGEIDIWETATGALQNTLEHYKPWVADVKFLQNGTLALMYRDGTVRLFDQITGTLCRIIERPIQDYEPPLVPGIRTNIDSDAARPSLSILPGGDLVILLPNGHVWTWRWEGSTWSRFSVPGITISRLYGCLSNGALVAGILQDGATKTTELSLLDPATSAVQSLKSMLSSWALAVAVSSLDVIAWGADDGSIELYDADNGSLSELKGHPKGVLTALTFSPDGKSLVSAGGHKIIRLWDLSTQAKSLVDTALSEVGSAAFSPDGKYMAAISTYGRTIQLYGFPISDLSRLREVQPAVIESINVSPDGQQVAAILNDRNVIQIYNTERGALEHTLFGHSAWIVAIAFSQDGERLVSASFDETIRLWSPKTGASGMVVSGIPGLAKVVIIAFSPNGKHVVSGNEEGIILILDAESGLLNHAFELSSRVDAITFLSDSRRIAFATSRACARSIGVWDTSTGSQLQEFGDSEPSLDSETWDVVQAAISPNGKHFSYSIGLMAAVIYDMGSKEKRELPDTSDTFSKSLAFSRDSKFLATCTSYGDIQVWDVASARLIGFSPVNVSVDRLSFPTDGTFLESEFGHIPIRRIQADSFGDVSGPLTHWRYSWDDEWIMEGARKMLWIPPAFTSGYRHIAHHAGLFVIVHRSGEVRFMKFNQGEPVTDMQE